MTDYTYQEPPALHEQLGRIETSTGQSADWLEMIRESSKGSEDNLERILASLENIASCSQTTVHHLAGLRDQVRFFEIVLVTTVVLAVIARFMGAL